MHRLFALRAGLRGGARDLRAHHRGTRLRLGRFSGDGREVPRVRMRIVRRLRAGLSDRDPQREVRHRDRYARAFGGDHLRLLRRRLFVQGGDARRRAGAHGAVQGRQGQSRPFLRQGPLRLGLCQPPRAYPQTDDPRQDHRSLARGDVGRGIRAHRVGVQAHPGDLRQGLGRRHHLVALHQRGDLPGAEADPRGLRQQQCRHLRARLPLADRLRPVQDLRHLGRHPGLRFRRARRRGDDHRRQSDRRPSGVRVAAEEAAAAGRQADRGRPAPHRHRAQRPCRGCLSPAAAAGHQCLSLIHI